MVEHNHLKAEDIKRKYDSGLGSDYMSGEFFRENILGVRRMRRSVFQHARGSILDVACGSGESFMHYRHPGNTYTAIELSSAMLSGARERASKLNMSIDLREMDAEHLDFLDNTFDTVVSAMSTCTFPNPVETIREMQRVVKPDGQILLVEHGRSSWEWIGRWQDRRAPDQYAEGGCRFNQEPEEVVAQAGLKILSARHAMAGIFSMLQVSPTKS